MFPAQAATTHDRGDDVSAEGACAMAPLVEAHHDKRLGGREQASLDRHLASCAGCRALAQDLDALGDMARIEDAPRLTPLEHRRARTSLLRAAAGNDGAPRRRPRAPSWAVLAFAAGIALGAGLLRRDPPPPELARRLPPPVRLAAIEAPPPSVKAEAARAPAVHTAAPAASPPRVAKVPPPPQPTATSAAPNEGGAFAEGVAAAGRGDYATAAARLSDFAAQRPGDARAEDAAFLAVLALDRAGRAEAAATAARGYLSRYPGGYRASEIQAILDRQNPH
jgi:TolA-binding protein